jgi:uncharacterized protein (DUF697 family)
MMMNDDRRRLNDEFQKELEAQAKRIQRPTILVCGYTGTGKTSLIRAICGNDLVSGKAIVPPEAVGHGSPATKDYIFYAGDNRRRSGCRSYGGWCHPLPISDALLISPIQMGMIVSLAFLYGFPAEPAKAMIMPLLAETLGVLKATSLSNFIPGLGQVIQAVVAAALTEVIGQLTNQYLIYCSEARLRGERPPTFHPTVESIADLV